MPPFCVQNQASNKNAWQNLFTSAFHTTYELTPGAICPIIFNGEAYWQ